MTIVDIDEKSLEKYGQWAWPRFKTAELMEKINQDAPLAVGVDIIFSEPDRTSLNNIYKNLSNQFNINIDISKIPDYLHDNDSFLVDAFAKGNFVSSIYLTFNGGKSNHSCMLHPLNFIVRYDNKAFENNIGLFKANGIICNLPIFNNILKTSGFINMKPDVDGILRRVPLIMEYQGKIYPSLSLATFIASIKPKRQILEVSQYGVKGIVLDDFFIPLDNQGCFPIKFREPSHSFEYISAVDILDGNVPLGKFNKKIVFVGTSAAGLHDYHSIPFDSILSGVEINANIVDNILTKNFIEHPNRHKGAEITMIIITGLIVSFIFARFGAGVGLTLFIFGGPGLFFGTKTFFAAKGMFISPIFPVLCLSLNFSIIYLLKYYISERTRRNREKEISRMQDAVMKAVIMATETRDHETGGHIMRTQNYIRAMIEALYKSENYGDNITQEKLGAIYKTAPLHDVGKVGIPDTILLKTGILTKEEFDIIKQHTTYGKAIIGSALKQVGKNLFLETALDIAYTHHEKWDGSGYPRGISGETIPFSGRLMAIADVYDALISRRPYKEPITHEKAVDIIKSGRGTHFDPNLIDIFIKIHESFRKIAMEFAESKDEKNL